MSIQLNSAQTDAEFLHILSYFSNNKKNTMEVFVLLNTSHQTAVRSRRQMTRMSRLGEQFNVVYERETRRLRHIPVN